MHDLVIIPTYNERKNIKYIISRLRGLYPELHILVVDDSSPDGTGKVVKSLQDKDEKISLLERQKKNGLGEAYKDALSKVRSDGNLRYIFTMDADGSHDPVYIKEMRRRLADNDLVVASRYTKGGGVENWEFWRKLLSWGGNMYSRIVTGSNISDLTAGFIGVRRELVERIDFDKLHSSGYAYQIEFKIYCVNKLKAKVCEMPIIFKSRRGGESKMSNQIIHEGFITPIRILWRRLKR